MTTGPVFAPIWTDYNTTLVQVLPTQVSSDLSAVAGYVMAALSLYVIITGFLVIYGRMAWEGGMRRITRALLVVAVLTPTVYSEYIVGGFTQTWPQAVSVAFGGSGVASNDDQTTQAFDQLLASVEAVKELALATGGSNPYYIPQEISAWLAAAAAEVLLAIGFTIWFLARALIPILVRLGPYLMLFYLFDVTRDIPARLISKLVGGMILIAMVLIIVGIVQEQEKGSMRAVAAVMQQAATSAPSPPISSYTQMGPPPATQSVDEIVSTVWHIALDFGIGTFLLLMVSSTAAYIGGGVAFSVAPLIASFTNRMWGPRR